MALNFYKFQQNNTFGRWQIVEGVLGYAVYVQAYTAASANEIAQELGIYFDGCDNNRDCSCCGDRWSRADEGEGSEVPLMYGKPLEKQRNLFDLPIYVHYRDGRVVEFHQQREAA